MFSPYQLIDLPYLLYRLRWRIFLLLIHYLLDVSPWDCSLGMKKDSASIVMEIFHQDLECKPKILMILSTDEKDQQYHDDICEKLLQEDHQRNQRPNSIMPQVGLYVMTGQSNPRILRIAGQIGSSTVQVLVGGNTNRSFIILTSQISWSPKTKFWTFFAYEWEMVKNSIALHFTPRFPYTSILLNLI